MNKSMFEREEARQKVMMGKIIFNSSTCALQVNCDQEPQSSSNAFPFTKEQLDKLYELLKLQTPTSSIAQKGNFSKYVHLGVIPNHTWIVDSGATDHMTGDFSLLSSYKPCAGNFKIKVVDGSLSAVAGKCSIVLSPQLTIQDVLHIPNLSCNLLSINKLTKNKNCQTLFFDNYYVFHDLISGQIIGSAKQSGGLYYFEDEPETRHQSGPISSSIKIFFVSNNKDGIMLWHLRLGHPSFKYLKALFRKLFERKDISSFSVRFVNLLNIIEILFQFKLINLQNLFQLFIAMFGGLIKLVLYPTKNCLSPLRMIILDFVGYTC